MKNKKCKAVAFALAFAIAVGALATVNCTAETSDDISGIKAVFNELSSPGTEIADNSVILDDTDRAQWAFEIEKSGDYNIKITYAVKDDAYSSVEQKLYIDGEKPADGVSYIVFPREFRQGKIERTDISGNDIKPEVIQNKEKQSIWVSDPSGYIDGRLEFYLESGAHILELEGMRGKLAVENITLVPCEVPMNYKDYKSAQKDEAKEFYEEYQAENIYGKSDITVEPKTDRSSAFTSPQDAVSLKLNSIGGESWRLNGQTLSWKIKVDRSGYYRIGARYKQSFVDGCFVSRSLLIDGESPFKEAEGLKFDYSDSWQTRFFGEDGGYLFYLSAGEHILSLVVSLGEISAQLGEVQNSLVRLNEIYRNIIMHTGPVPDKYRSYNFEDTMPDVLEEIKKQHTVLSGAVDNINKITESNSEYAVVLNKVVRQLGEMYDDPEENIPVLLEQYKSNIGALGTWLLEATEQPLLLDKLIVASSDMTIKEEKNSFLKNLFFQLKCFISSFSQDYNSVGLTADAEYEDEITVWVPTGRDQAQIIRELSQGSFSADNSVKVNLKLVNAGNLLPSVLGGSAPDAALTNGMETVMDYAIRNAICPVSDFEDFSDVSERFVPQALVPYTYDGKVYACPEEFVFNMFFYRLDIFAQLGIAAPETWEEFMDIIPVVQSQNMNIGVDMSLFYIMLYQNGGQLYFNEGEKTALTSDAAKASFKNYCELYTLYRLPASYDFANRFRTGEMPCGIQSYTLYNQLAVFAPEIKGLWEMIPVPGIRREDGSIDHISVSASGSAAFILDSSHKKELAWKFLKWWTSDETQSTYGLKMESVLGSAAKQPTANVEALTKMSWSSDEYKNLLMQLEDVEAIPQVPGGYYTGRVLSFAFNKAYNEMAEPVETLEGYYEELNSELARKRREFSDYNK